ncbi:MAG: hypothetical protein ABFS10_01060 [Bacteroidota bacterium]
MQGENSSAQLNLSAISDWEGPRMIITATGKDAVAEMPVKFTGTGVGFIQGTNMASLLLWE